MAQKSNWFSEQGEILIDFVKCHEALYNIKSAEYRKIQLKQTLWHEIGKKLHKTDCECSKRWTYIRDYYIRKRGKPGTGSAGEAAKRKSKLLSFLDSCPNGTRSTVSNVQNEEDSQYVEEEDILSQIKTESMSQNNENEQQGDSFLSQDVSSPGLYSSNLINDTPQSSSFIRSSKKRKIGSSTSEARLGLLKEIANRPQQDENDLFFASMAKIVKKLPPQDQVKIRLDIANMISNAELQMYNHNPTNTTYFITDGPSTSTDERGQYNYIQS